MNTASLSVSLCLAAGLALLAQFFAQERPAAIPPSIEAEAVANPPGLPAIGKWMIAADGTVAHWLREIHQGKRLHEPVVREERGFHAGLG
jgi:hypothetical protein